MNRKRHPRVGTRIIGRFLFGQGLVTAVNVVVGLVIVRMLPLSEYALYVSASLLLTLISTGSDMGLSQGVTSLGARVHNSPASLDSLVVAALRYRKRFFAVAAMAVLLVGYFMFQDRQWGLDRVSVVVAMVVAIGWVQSPLGIRKAVLNINHDEQSLFKIGISEAAARFGTVWICLLSPTVESALFINLLGFIAARVVVIKQFKPLHLDVAVVSEEHSRQLRDFVIPLMPAVIYYMMQAQLSVFLLNIYGYTDSVAHVGALGRLGQVIGLLMMLNPFLVQPFFARLDERREFVLWVGVVVITLALIAAAIVVSGYVFPTGWLFILGQTYSELTTELPFAHCTIVNQQQQE